MCAAMKDRLRHVVFIVFILALAAFVRVKAALELPTDFDEPVYVGAGLHYAQALREGDLGEIARYDYNLEHPVLVKLLYGAGIALSVPDADPFDALTVSRMISVFFGVALVALVTAVEPFAGLALALHTMNTKYTSQAYLEALPAFTSALCVLAIARSTGRGDPRGRPDRWFWLSALALGVTAASKYVYLVVGLVVVGWLIWDVRRRTLRWRDPFLFLLVATLVFFALNPILWADPVGRLVDSVTYHGAYTQSAEVVRYGYAWWKPLDYMFHSFPTQWHEGVFLFPLDELIFLGGLVGLGWLLWPTRLGRALRQAWARWRGRTRLAVPPSPPAPLRFGDSRALAGSARDSLAPHPSPLASRLPPLVLAWFVVGALFLFLWPTKWPQYTLITTTPLCLAFGLVTAEVWRRVREDREYWEDLTYGLFPREFWVALSLMVVLLVGLYAWRGIVRRQELRGWTTYSRATSPLPSNVVQAIAFDGQGRTWLGTTRGVAVVELPPQGQEGRPLWQTYTQANAGLLGNDVLAVAGGDAGRVWVGTSRGLSLFDLESGDWTTFTPQDAPLPADGVRAITPAPDGGVWLATSAGARLLTPTAGAPPRWEWQVYEQANSALLSDAVFDITLHDRGDQAQVWFATDSGVSVLDLADQSWTNYTSENSGLAWNGVSGIVANAQGYVWFATLGRGVSALAPDGTWQTYNVGNSDLPWNITTTSAAGCACGERAGGLWFGTDVPSGGTGSQIAAYVPGDGGEWRVFGPRNSGLPDSAVSDVAVQCGDPGTCDGMRVWVATRTAGVAVYEVPNP